MSMSLKQLRETPTMELIRLHDEMAPNTNVGVSYYLEELARRDTEGSTAAMVKLTKAMAILTVVITVATIVSTVAVLKG